MKTKKTGMLEELKKQLLYSAKEMLKQKIQVGKEVDKMPDTRLAYEKLRFHMSLSKQYEDITKEIGTINALIKERDQALLEKASSKK